jgi:GNAT superfamily N-acetyltransferase
VFLEKELAMQSTSVQLSFAPVQEISDPLILSEICRFRARVWHQIGQLTENAFSEEGWRDPIDSDCQHWIIRDSQSQIVASGRLSIHGSLEDVHQATEYMRFGLKLSGPVAAPDRVVVCPSAQGCGLGRQILDVQDHTAQLRGARHAVRQASSGMVRLLQHRGWQILGPASSDDRFPGVVFRVAVKEF